MEKEKSPGYEVINDPERLKSIVLDELKCFKKGFGIDIKLYDNYTNLPEPLNNIIEQYYVSALIMVPNVTRNTGAPPYDGKSSGAVFENARKNVFDKIYRNQEGIDTLIELYQKLEKVEENEKKTILTHIKLIETDIYNNIAHTYDKTNEKGTLDGKENILFTENYSSNAHLTHSVKLVYSKEESDFVEKTRLTAINKYIRNSLSKINALIGRNDRSNLPPPRVNGKPQPLSKDGIINLNDFNETCQSGFRRGLMAFKDRNILELIKGDYNITPIVAIVPNEINNRYISDKADQIIFVGKNDNYSVVSWHIGSSGELAHSQTILNFKERYPLKDIEKIVKRDMPKNASHNNPKNNLDEQEIRAMPNMNLLIRATKKEPETLQSDSTSLLDKLVEMKRLIKEREKYKGNTEKQAEYNDKIKNLRRQMKFPEISAKSTEMLKTLRLKELTDRLKGPSGQPGE